jgi:FkbM family methyltransferase
MIISEANATIKKLDEFHLYIADVGAYGGLHSRWNQGLIRSYAYLFDPIFKHTKPENDSNLRFIGEALGEVPEVKNLNLCSKTEVSSFYLPNYDFLKEFPDVDRYQIIGSMTTQVSTLDKELADEPLDFMKIDTQGFGLNVLNGSINKIKNMIGIEIELDFVPIYCGGSLFAEVNDFLNGQDMILMDIKQVYWSRKNLGNLYIGKGELIWGDGLYFKRQSKVKEIIEQDKRKLGAAIGCYLAYGYYSLAKELADAFCVSMPSVFENELLLGKTNWRQSD